MPQGSAGCPFLCWKKFSRAGRAIAAGVGRPSPHKRASRQRTRARISARRRTAQRWNASPTPLRYPTKRVKHSSIPLAACAGRATTTKAHRLSHNLPRTTHAVRWARRRGSRDRRPRRRRRARQYRRNRGSRKNSYGHRGGNASCSSNFRRASGSWRLPRFAIRLWCRTLSRVRCAFKSRLGDLCSKHSLPISRRNVCSSSSTIASTSLRKRGAVAGSLLRECPSVALLATSREALNVTGERAYRIPSLSIPEHRKASATVVGRSVPAPSLSLPHRVRAADSRFEVTT